MRLTKNTSHKKLCGSEWFNKESGVPHIVAFLGEGSIYMVVDLETGEVPFSSDDIREVIEELKQNYE